MKASALIAVIVAALTAAGAGGSASRADPLRQALDAVVAAGTPGALLLVDGPDGRYEAASGQAVLAGGVPLRPGDRFRAGSITKTFVAVVVLQLVAERRLRLDDTIGRWLPGLVPGGGRITIRQLLGHRSGLADYVTTSFLRRTVNEPRRRWRPRELVRLAVAMGPVGRPGERYAYSSTNYVLLGLLVERVTGAPLGRELRLRIFKPLGLRDTSFAPNGRIPGRHVHGYTPTVHDGIVGSLASARDRSTAGATWAWAAGAIVSTAPELSRFFGALLRGGLLPARFLELMPPAAGTRYGLGLAAFHTPCGLALGHTGNVLGTVSAAWSSPDGRRRVVAMSNSYPLAAPAEAGFRRLLNAAYC